MKKKTIKQLGFNEKKKQRQEILSAFSVVEPNIVLYHRIESPTVYQGQQTWLIAHKLALQSSSKYFIFDMGETSIPPPENREIAKENMELLDTIFEKIIVVNEDKMMKEYIKVFANSLQVDFDLTCVNTISEAIEIIERDNHKTIKLGLGKDGR